MSPFGATATPRGERNGGADVPLLARDPGGPGPARAAIILPSAASSTRLLVAGVRDEHLPAGATATPCGSLSLTAAPGALGTTSAAASPAAVIKWPSAARWRRTSLVRSLTQTVPSCANASPVGLKKRPPRVTPPPLLHGDPYAISARNSAGVAPGASGTISR